MTRQRATLRAEQVQELSTAYAECRDGATRTRYQAVRLYGEGYAVGEIIQITQCSRSRLMSWVRAYRAVGVGGLRDQRVGGNRAKLNEQQVSELKDLLPRSTPRAVLGVVAASDSGQFWTVPDLRRVIEHRYGVQYASPSSYARLFKQCGFSYQRTEKVFRSRREADVHVWQEGLEKN